MGHRRPAQHRLRVRPPDLVEDDDAVRRVPDGRPRRRLPEPPRAQAVLRRLRRRLRTAPALRASAPRWSRRARSTVSGRSSPADPTARRTRRHAGVLVANGTLSEPTVPAFPGALRRRGDAHQRYKRAEVFAGKRVLIIGAGNSGCDIAVDAVHHAASVDMSVRRGYYFVPKYLFGRPADTLNNGRPLPPRIKQAVDSRLLKMFTGDPVRFGFPEPDYRIYESHPVVNTADPAPPGPRRHPDAAGRGALRRRRRAVQGRRTGRVRPGRAGHRLPAALPVPRPGPAELGRTRAPAARPTSTSTSSPRPTRTSSCSAWSRPPGSGWQGRYEQGELVAAYLKARQVAPGPCGRARAAGRRAAARPHRRLPLPGTGADELLRQQGRLPGRGPLRRSRCSRRAVRRPEGARHRRQRLPRLLGGRGAGRVGSGGGQRRPASARGSRPRRAST